MIADIVAVVFGLILLYKGGEWLLRGAVSVAEKYNFPRVLIGLTLVSFVTSLPELAVVLNANLEGLGTLALSNVIGSNISNIALVLGMVLLLARMKLERNILGLLVLMIGTTIIFSVLVFVDNAISIFDGILLLIVATFFLIAMFRFQKSVIIENGQSQVKVLKSQIAIISIILIGGFCLWLGSEVLIKGINGISSEFGISLRVLGLTVAAVGTSLPELAASIVAIVKKEKGVSLGNIIGSNVFNLLLVMGISSVIKDLQIPVEYTSEFQLDLLAMLFISFLIVPLVLFGKKYRLGKIEGVILLLLYGTYMFIFL